MRQRTIKKEDLNKLIASVGKDGRFYGPLRGGDGVSLSPLGPDDQVALDYFNFTLPPKHLLLPRSEVICTYQGGEMTEAPVVDEKAVIFGVRPCDALSFHRLEKVFLDEKFADPYFRRRRDNSIVISLACSDPLETCFCTSVGGSPAGGEGADILAFDVGDRLLFEAVTARGEDFMKAQADIFEEPNDQDLKAREAQASGAEKKVSAVDVSGVTEKLQAQFDSPIWDTIAETCLGCGVCTYACPTCHCFGLYDEKADVKGGRIRVQDSCMFPSFTLEASGHNPRTSNGQRMRQRIMHKFRYTVENFGDIFCVGCGRCILHCPVNVDVRETIAEVNK